MFFFSSFLLSLCFFFFIQVLKAEQFSLAPGPAAADSDDEPETDRSSSSQDIPHGGVPHHAVVGGGNRSAAGSAAAGGAGGAGAGSGNGTRGKSMSIVDATEAKLWARFMLNGEEVIYTELLEKGNWPFRQTRQLILTSLPRFLYIDVTKLVQKGEIQWSKDLWVESKDNKNFVIHTPTRDWYFESSQETGSRTWSDIINTVRKAKA
jgi:hypothetical protein